MNKTQVCNLTANTFILLGLLGIGYKAITNQISSKSLNKIITTYHTFRMWGLRI